MWLATELLDQKQLQALQLQGLRGRPFHRVKGIPRHTRSQIQKVWPTLADDTSLCCRLSSATETLLRSTLSQWGETIKDAKTKRLIIGANNGPVLFEKVDSAKLPAVASNRWRLHGRWCSSFEHRGKFGVAAAASIRLESCSPWSLAVVRFFDLQLYNGTSISFRIYRKGQTWMNGGEADPGLEPWAAGCRQAQLLACR